MRLFKADAGAPRGLLGAPRQTEQMLPVVHAAVGGCSRLLGPGLLLILNDKLVGRIHLANVDLPTDYAQVSFGFIHQGLNFCRILHILVFSEGVSYPPDGVSSK